MEESKAIATHPGFRAEAIQLDVSLEESVKNAITHTVALFGRIDYCIHSAGVSLIAPNPPLTFIFLMARPSASYFSSVAVFSLLA